MVIGGRRSDAAHVLEALGFHQPGQRISEQSSLLLNHLAKAGRLAIFGPEELIHDSSNPPITLHDPTGPTPWSAPAQLRLFRSVTPIFPTLRLGHRILGRLSPKKQFPGSWRANANCATHNRVCALEIGIPIDYENGKRMRLLEDHGVCLSSCLDYWEDDLVLQALQRNLILAPELYGSPWFLRDDEFPKLARIHNLTRSYRDILVNALFLPDQTYGSNAVSRGDRKTRIVTLTNPTWNPVTRTVTLDESIGLGSGGPYDVRRLHPSEEILGQFKKGDTVEIVIPAFRSYALLVSTNPSREPGVSGCSYEVVRDVPGKPAIIKLLGMPGTTATVRLPAQPRTFANASLDGKPAPELLQGKSRTISFPGNALKQPWYRKLNDLTPVDVPADAESLYEATCFAANNNAMEIRSKFRSGPTAIRQVKAARDAFFGQKLLVERGAWDRYLFDDDLTTYFRVMNGPIWGGALRIDMGAPTRIDKLIFRPSVS
ncbi:MAG: hypothetical protein K9N23_01155 [Akkermansiaceae bacterium]|nr:hypothetical protein [Akkermansiaceae bacterium]